MPRVTFALLVCKWFYVASFVLRLRLFCVVVIVLRLLCFSTLRCIWLVCVLMYFVVFFWIECVWYCLQRVTFALLVCKWFMLLIYFVLRLRCFVCICCIYVRVARFVLTFFYVLYGRTCLFICCYPFVCNVVGNYRACDFTLNLFYLLLCCVWRLVMILRTPNGLWCILLRYINLFYF